MTLALDMIAHRRMPWYRKHHPQTFVNTGSIFVNGDIHSECTICAQLCAHPGSIRAPPCVVVIGVQNYVTRASKDLKHIRRRLASADSRGMERSTALGVRPPVVEVRHEHDSALADAMVPATASIGV